MRARLWLIIGLQALALLAMAGYYQYIISFGTVARLQADPYDPLSLFQGRYVYLAYNITELDEVALRAPRLTPSDPRAASFWVTLERADPYWKAIALDLRRPVGLPENQVALKGSAVWGQEKGKVRLKYGIESFFAPEELAPELEARGRKDSFEVDVAIGPGGRALIKQVFLKGKPVDLIPR